MYRYRGVSILQVEPPRRRMRPFIMLLHVMPVSCWTSSYQLRKTRWTAHAEPSVLLQASRADGTIVGQVGVDMRDLSRDGRSRTSMLYGEGADAQDVAPRALLCELYVQEACRRQGLGRDLCVACEAVVRDEWGMEELLLFVDSRNDKAISLYLGLGYEWISSDQTNQRDQSGPAWLNWLSKATADPVCMRKRL